MAKGVCLPVDGCCASDEETIDLRRVVSFCTIPDGSYLLEQVDFAIFIAMGADSFKYHVILVPMISSASPLLDVGSCGNDTCRCAGGPSLPSQLLPVVVRPGNGTHASEVRVDV